MPLGFILLAAAALTALSRRRAARHTAAHPHSSSASGGEGFGEAIRREYHVDFTYTHVNHGSYGACPRPVLETLAAETVKLETFPDGALAGRGRL